MDGPIVEEPAVLEPEAPRPRYGVVLTATLYFIGAAILIAATLGSDLRRGNPKHLKHPAELAASLEIGLEFEPTFASLPAWVRWLAKKYQPDVDDPFRETLEAYRDVLSLPDLRPEHQDAIRGRVAVLLAEQGRWPEATAVLDSMTEGEDARAFRATMRDAYGEGDSLVAAAPALAVLSPRSPVGWKSDWTSNRVAARFARRHGHPDAAAALDAALEAKARRWLVRCALALAPVLAVLAAAVAIVAVWLRRWRRPRLRVAHALIPPPWFTVDGFGVFLWASILSMPFAFMGDLAGEGRIPAVVGWPLYFGSVLPYLFLMRRHLVGPFGVRARDALGLRIDRGTWRSLVATCIVVYAADMIVEYVVMALLSSHVKLAWWEGTMEPLVFGGPVTFVTGAAGLTFGAPLLEETAFRGILYPTLRKFLPPVPAMLGIGIFFGVQHPYGLAGMAATAVMGAWAACVYEVTRSLWPSLVLHAVNNGVVMLLVALFQR